MTYIDLPSTESRDLPFYLAMEEYVARRFDTVAFFMWQVAPTVIFGRNQVAQNELDLDYCGRAGIQFYRRKSGGGCVYADMDNIMFSCIVPSDSVVTTFADYTGKVARMLHELGMDAVATGRNDILIGERKVSGNAFYHIPGRSIIHGTMLYSTDVETMMKVLSPPGTKLQSHGVDSVKSRITTIKEHVDISIDEFKEHARKSLCDTSIMLTDEDVAAIEEMSREYLDPDWIYGKTPHCGLNVSRRVDGVGEFNIGIDIAKGRIAEIEMTGDFFVIGDVGELLELLRGVLFTREGISAALEGVDAGNVIAGLKTEQLINLIYNNHE